jgi:pimeloyl-ACP methyl ester carboxylesterase
LATPGISRFPSVAGSKRRIVAKCAPVLSWCISMAGVLWGIPFAAAAGQPLPALAFSPLSPPSMESANNLLSRYAVCLESSRQEGHPGPVRLSLPTDLTRQEATAWKRLLWRAWVAMRRKRSGIEYSSATTGTGQVASGEHRMQYTWQRSGVRPGNGWPLFINLHGGGNNKEMNDQAWEMARTWYAIKTGYHVCPRAPVDEVESWIMKPFYPLLGELLKDFLALMDVDPNRVYVIGFSMGGWGALHLGPVLADHWAAAAASSGGGFIRRSPPHNLRNTPMMINVGAEDSSYMRNSLSKKFADFVVALRESDKEGYILNFRQWPGHGHMIPEDDTPAWCAGFVRDPTPTRIVWYQPWTKLAHDPAFSGMLRQRFYWLRNDDPRIGQRLIVVRNGNSFDIKAGDVYRVSLLLDDRVADLEKPIRVQWEGLPVFEAMVPRRLETLVATLWDRGDPALMFSAECAVLFPAVHPGQ